MKKRKIALIGLASLLALNLLMPTKIQNPVEGCGRESYNPKSFWHPWGDHKHAGIDIFAKKGTNVHPAIGGIVVATAHNVGLGGNFILIFSSGFRFHYYAFERDRYPYRSYCHSKISDWQSGKYR